MRTEKEIITQAKKILKETGTLKHMYMGTYYWHVTTRNNFLSSYVINNLVHAKIKFYVTTDGDDDLRLGICIKE